MNEYKENSMRFYVCGGCGGYFESTSDHSCIPKKTNPHDLVMGTLTKREYLAAIALTGYTFQFEDVTESTKECARIAVLAADALIEELNK